MIFVPMRGASIGSRTLMVLLAVLATACDAPRPALEPLRGVILISIDTLRADHLGTYGYERDTSPFLDELASRGVVFEHEYAQLPGTLSSHMSIFTGLYPAEHGVFAPDGVLSREILTVPQILQRNGFRTGGFTEGGYVDGHFGFDRGFDEFSDEKKAIYSDIERTVARGLNFLEEVEENERFFLFLHSYAVHDPYFPPEPFASRYWEGPVPETFPPTGPNLIKFNRGELAASKTDVEYFKALYDGSIRYMDGVLEGFFADLERLGLLEETAIIVTSDHGEEFLEHGKLVHQQLYSETLRVPLIVVSPGLDSRRVSQIVQSIDLAPTILELAGVEPEGYTSGRSLVPLMLGTAKDDAAAGEAYAEIAEEASRTLIWQADSGDLSQLLYHPEVVAGGKLWVEHRTRVDVVQNPLVFRAWAYREPRILTLAMADGSQQWPIELPAEEWSSVEIELPPTGPKWSLTMESPGCASFVNPQGEALCLSVQIVGPELARLELYDLTKDPAAAQDLSSKAPQILKSMLRRLPFYERDAVAGREREELGAELEERLKALGYLQ